MVRPLLFASILICGCDPPEPTPEPQPRVPFTASPDKYFDLVVRAAPIDDTKPVSDKCENCNGKGWVGDSVVRQTCDVCGGSGKKTTRSETNAQISGCGNPLCKCGPVCPCGDDCQCGKDVDFIDPYGQIIKKYRESELDNSDLALTIEHRR